MTYEFMVQVSQIAALIFFLALFAAVLIYVFWPSNKPKFDAAARIPLQREHEADRTRGPA